MKKYILILLAIIASTHVFAADVPFISKKNGKLVTVNGEKYVGYRNIEVKKDETTGIVTRVSCYSPGYEKCPLQGYVIVGSTAASNPSLIDNIEQHIRLNLSSGKTTGQIVIGEEFHIYYKNACFVLDDDNNPTSFIEYELYIYSNK